MFHFLSKILSFVIAPYHWILLCVLLAFFIKNPKAKRKLGFLAILLYMIFGNRALINSMYSLMEPAPLFQQNIITPYEYGVVLGGGFAYSNANFPDRVFFRDHINRLTEAMELYHTGKIRKIILSGGVGGLSRFKDLETEHIKSFLLENNWPDSVILVESTSRNTMENAKNTKAILDAKNYNNKILLITSALHMPRAAACFKKQGMPFDAYPADYQQKDKVELLQFILPGMDVVGEWHAVFHEWIGTMVYRWKKYI